MPYYGALPGESALHQTPTVDRPSSEFSLGRCPRLGGFEDQALVQPTHTANEERPRRKWREGVRQKGKEVKKGGKEANKKQKREQENGDDHSDTFELKEDENVPALSPTLEVERTGILCGQTHLMSQADRTPH